MNQISRRHFLRQTTTLCSMGAAVPLGVNLSAITAAAAQSTSSSGYRALVCVFMQGGNDAFNTVLATDTSSWSSYVAQRQPTDGSAPIALPKPGVVPNASAAGTSPDRLGGVLPISHAGRAVHAGRQFAFHPAMTQLQQLHQSGRAAVLANVGPLTRPTSKADWSDARASKPVKLFSHNDQQSTWQTFNPEGASPGWGGLMGDLLMQGNGAGRSDANVALIKKSFTCMTPSGSAIWLGGRNVLPYQSHPTHVMQLGYGSQIYGNSRLYQGVANVLGKLSAQGTPTVSAGNLFASDMQAVAQRGLLASDLLNSALAPLGVSPWSTGGAINPYADPMLMYTSPVDGSQKLNLLALQLQMVARLIDTNRTASLGMSRQLFMVNLNGFDTHNGQIGEHGERMAQLNHAMAYFDRVLGNMPAGDMRSQVTTFTASEFGRTFTSNGDGTDHGWGGHHLIMGGAVIGTEVYGTFPTYSTANSQGVFSSPDQIQNGVLIPSTSVDQYAYTLGKWMGVSDSNLQAILPNLSQFNSSAYDLGFLRA